jgi:hypothetical protein
VPGGEEDRVAFAVPVEGLLAAVRGVGVDLDDELVRGPEGVHLEALDHRVEEGFGEFVVPDQTEELAFLP